MASEEITPETQIKISGSRNQDIEDALLSARVMLSLNLADVCVLEIEDETYDPANASDSIADSFDIGDQIEVLMGYQPEAEFKTLIKADVVRIEHDYTQGKDPIRVIVTAFGPEFRLMRIRHTRSFSEMTYTDIASQLIGEASLSASVDSSSLSVDYVFQNNLSNWEFLSMLAKRINYDLRVEDGTLYFSKQSSSHESSVTLKFGEDTLDARFSTDGSRMMDKVNVMGWDSDQQQEISSEVSAGSEETAVDDGSSGASHTKSKFSSYAAEVYKLDQPVASTDEAQDLATSILSYAANEYQKVEGTCMGDTDIKAGKTIKFEGVADKVSGSYLVTSCKHEFSGKQGYLTYFTGQRSAYNG